MEILPNIMGKLHIRMQALCTFVAVIHCLSSNALADVNSCSNQLDLKSFQSFKIEIIPSFDNPTVIEYRFMGYGRHDWNNPYTKILSVEIYDGRGGYDWGKVSKSEVKRIEKREAEKILEDLNDIDLHKLFMSYDDPGGNDGTRYRITVNRNGSTCQFSFSQLTAKKNDESKAVLAILDYIFEIFKKAEPAGVIKIEAAPRSDHPRRYAK